MVNMEYRIFVSCEVGHSFFVYADCFEDVTNLIRCLEAIKIESINITKVGAESQEDNAGKEVSNGL